MDILQTTAAALCAASLLFACAGAPATIASAPAEDGHWVPTWATAQQETEPGNNPNTDLSGATLRQRLRVSMGGERLRLKFSNAFGNGPVAIAQASIALSAEGSAVDAETLRSITFDGGKPSVTIPSGREVYSDPLDFQLAPLADVTVSLFFASVPRAITGHPGSRTTSFIRTGNMVSAGVFPAGGEDPAHWYILAGAEVLAPAQSAAVAILGDSITDGRGSTTNGNDRWPDFLARKLQSDPATAGVGVLNAGIGGNAVLQGGLGPTAQMRLERDVLNQKNVKWMILFEGVNDIGGISDKYDRAARAQDLVSAYKRMIAAARARGIRVYGCTITPFKGHSYYTPESEAARQALNKWIRAAGHVDAVIDFDAVTRDGADPERLQKAYDSGDGLHLSPAGYRAMGESIDTALFK